MTRPNLRWWGLVVPFKGGLGFRGYAGIGKQLPLKGLLGLCRDSRGVPLKGAVRVMWGCS